MNTHEKQVATYNELETIYERNNPVKERKRAHELTLISEDLMLKRMIELAGKDRLLIAYMKQVKSLDLRAEKNESSASVIKRITDPENFSWAPAFCRKHRINKPEVFLDLANKQMHCGLTIYCELVDSPGLSSKVKVQKGHQMLEISRNMVDIGGVQFTSEIERMVSSIKRRVAELVELNSDGELYYWPFKNLHFDSVMEKSKEAGLIPDISLARAAFMNFENKGMRLPWNGSKRQLMYFLLRIYIDGWRSESITKIAFKLFDFKGKQGKNALRSFTTDLNCIRKRISDIHMDYAEYLTIHRITKSLT